MNKNQGESYGTGDMNLAAAIMTMGVPPERDVVKLIATSSGQDYVRFKIKDISIDGTIKTESLMDAWNNYIPFAKANPDNYFTKIMTFIRSKPDGCRGYLDWVEYASDWLGMPVNACKRCMNGSPKIWETAPDTEPAYVLGFLTNRFYLLDLAKKFQKTGRFDVMMEHGKSIALMSEHLPQRQKDFLISQMK